MIQIGALAAPILAVFAVYTAHYSGVWAPYAGVVLGYLAGVLAARYDIGVVAESDPPVVKSSGHVNSIPKS